jgi:hypothetical protein
VVIQTRLLRLNAVVYGVVTGMLLALGLFVATNWLVFKGGVVVGPHLGLLGYFLPGYRVTFTGSLIGLGYGLGGGFVLGYVVAWLYNRLADLRLGGGRGRR